MERISLKAEEREVLGKKVKKLRREGLVPGHVYGNKVESEHVTINAKDFLVVFRQTGETGLIDLKIGEEKIRPVMVREIQQDPRSGKIIHVDFYQVNLKEKVTVYIPIVLVGDEPEKVHIGEAIVLQPIDSVEVEALPTDLVEKIEVSIEPLKEVDDAITVENLSYDRSKLAVLTDPDEVVVKLAPAVTAEMEALMEEQEAEAAAAEAEIVEGEEGAEEKAEGEEGEETGEESAQEGGEESKQNDTEDKSKQE